MQIFKVLVVLVFAVIGMASIETLDHYDEACSCYPVTTVTTSVSSQEIAYGSTMITVTVTMDTATTDGESGEYPTGYGGGSVVGESSTVLTVPVETETVTNSLLTETMATPTPPYNHPQSTSGVKTSTQSTGVEVSTESSSHKSSTTSGVEETTTGWVPHGGSETVTSSVTGSTGSVSVPGYHTPAGTHSGVYSGSVTGTLSVSGSRSVSGWSSMVTGTSTGSVSGSVRSSGTASYGINSSSHSISGSITVLSSTPSETVSDMTSSSVETTATSSQTANVAAATGAMGLGALFGGAALMAMVQHI